MTAIATADRAEEEIEGRATFEHGMTELPLDEIHPDPENRKSASGKEAGIEELAASIKAIGLLHPIIVRMIPEGDESPTNYRIVAGERRWRAAKLLKRPTIECRIILPDEPGKGIDYARLARTAENGQRVNFTPMEEAEQVARLASPPAEGGSGLSHEAIGRCLGRTRQWVARRASLLNLSKKWRDAQKDPDMNVRQWPAVYLELIARMPANVQDEFLDRLNDEGYVSGEEPLASLDEIKQVGARLHTLLTAAPWKLDDELLVPKAGPCTLCPKRSSCQPDLFDDGEVSPKGGKKGDLCLDKACWAEKGEAYTRRVIGELSAEHPNLLYFAEDCWGDASRAKAAKRLPAGAKLITEFWGFDRKKKKGDKGALPALHVYGDQVGKVEWVVPRKDVGGDKIVKAAATKKPKTGAAAIADKQEAYDKRRRVYFTKLVLESLDAVTADSTPQARANAEKRPEAVYLRTHCLIAKTLELMNMTRETNRHLKKLNLPTPGRWGALANPVTPTVTASALAKRELDLLGLDTKWTDAVCWPLIVDALEVMALRLGRPLMGGDDGKWQFAEAEFAAMILGLDAGELRAKAAAEIPYAKGWAAGV